MKIYEQIIKAKISGLKSLAVLIDPDDTDLNQVAIILKLSLEAGIDYFFVGGSTNNNNKMDELMYLLKNQSDIPVVIFPGNPDQIHDSGDAFLLLSLISGRNPDLLIGHHVESARALINSSLEIIPTGYMLVDGGKMSAVQYISETEPIQRNDINLVVSTAQAGQLLGMKMIYLEAGSGALLPVPSRMIQSVSENTQIPLLVGGGISSSEIALKAIESGADIIVIGTAFENNPELLPEIAQAVHSLNTLVH